MYSVETLYGIIQLRGRAGHEVGYVIAFPTKMLGTVDEAIEEAIDAAIAEIKQDEAFMAELVDEYGNPTMRDLLAECSYEPFKRRGITFLPVYMEYNIDGGEPVTKGE